MAIGPDWWQPYLWLCGQILATHYRAPRAMHCRPSYSPPRPSSSCSPIPPPHTVARRHHTANLPPFLRTTMVSHPHGPQHRRRHREAQPRRHTLLPVFIRQPIYHPSCGPLRCRILATLNTIVTTTRPNPATAHCRLSSSHSQFATLHVDHYGATPSRPSTPPSPPP